MSDWRKAVKDQMESTGQTVATVAERMGMTEGGLRHWLNKTRTPSVDQFIDLCATIGLNPSVAISTQINRIDQAKLSSPTVDRALSATPQINENHKKFMTKIQSFKTNLRRIKTHR